MRPAQTSNVNKRRQVPKSGRAWESEGFDTYTNTTSEAERKGANERQVTCNTNSGERTRLTARRTNKLVNVALEGTAVSLHGWKLFERNGKVNRGVQPYYGKVLRRDYERTIEGQTFYRCD